MRNSLKGCVRDRIGKFLILLRNYISLKRRPTSFYDNLNRMMVIDMDILDCILPYKWENLVTNPFAY